MCWLIQETEKKSVECRFTNKSKATFTCDYSTPTHSCSRSLCPLRPVWAIKKGATEKIKARIKSGAQLISEERDRQVFKHGYDSEHDDKKWNKNNEMLYAAGYLMDSVIAPGKGNSPAEFFIVSFPSRWNHDCKDKFNSKDPVEKLTIAGALIAAEIDRLQRLNKDGE